MNWDQIEGNWMQLKGNIKKQWGKLTDDHLDMVAGDRDILVGKIQEEYGITKEEAETQLTDWQDQQGMGADGDDVVNRHLRDHRNS